MKWLKNWLSGLSKQPQKSEPEFVDDVFEKYQEKEKARYRADRAFKRIFYQQIDAMLGCETLMELKPELEYLIGLCDQIDGKEVYQPMRDFRLDDLQTLVYGLSNWGNIRQLIHGHGSIRQVDIISQLGLDKERAGYFLYTLDRLGVLRKEKQGRYNIYAYVSESISEPALRKSFWLFDEAKRVEFED